jgi:hypothetical protein
MVLPDPNVTPPTPPEPTPTPPEPTPPTPPAPQPGEDYEKRFKGLQSAYNVLKAKYDKLEQDHNTTLGELETIRQGDKSKADQVTQFQKDTEALKAEKVSLEAQVTSLQSQVARSKLIMADFQDLAGFEAQGLLPSGSTEEEMRAAFTKFKETYSKAISDAVAKRVTGTGPGPTGDNPPPSLSKDQIYNELTRYAGHKPGTPERKRYEELHAMWESLNKPS